jgi:MYND finger
LPAARQGHAMAQHIFSLKLGMHAAEGQMWLTLSAAQGYHPAQGMMDAMYYIEDSPMNKSYPKIFYWCRKAALKGCVQSQLLVTALLSAKTELYGYPHFVGHSALPESLYWCDLLRENKRYGNLKEVVVKFLNWDTCACCNAHGSNAKVRLCKACKTVRYCSRECQKRHWRMGHKVDCQGVDKLRKARTKPAFNISGMQGETVAFQATGTGVVHSREYTKRHV